MNLEDTLGQMDEKPLDGQSAEGEMPTDEAPPAEPKKMSINPNTLLLFGLLAAVGGATYLMCQRAGAQTNSGNPAAQQAASTISTFLNGGAQNLRQMMLMLHDTEKVVKQFDNYPSTTQIPLDSLHTNPFRTAGANVDNATHLTVDTTKLEEQEQQDAAQLAAKGLILQSVIVGPHSTCMIGGKMYREGQVTDQFTVQKITSDGVTLLIDSVPCQIKMSRPQLTD
jgi:hypothetical protein